jgi:uncharacterized protein VirK/YbjX
MVVIERNGRIIRIGNTPQGYADYSNSLALSKPTKRLPEPTNHSMNTFDAGPKPTLRENRWQRSHFEQLSIMLRSARLRHISSLPALTLWTFRLLLILSRSGPESNLRRFVRARPEIFLMAKGTYIAENWDARTRLTRIVDHCKTIEAIGGVVDFPPEKIVDLMQLPFLGPRYHVTLDQRRSLWPEGQMVINLMEGDDVLFCLSFCLSSDEGKLVSYIGCLLGRPDSLERYRALTKAAAMRPRDLIIKIFKSFCAALNVVEIRAVSDHNHPQHLKMPEIELSYDKVWIERGGVYDGDGFFILPIVSSRRSEQEIPVKRRALYRKRHAIYDALEAGMFAAVQATTGPRTLTARHGGRR